MPKRTTTLYNDFLTKVNELNGVRLNFENARAAGSINDIEILQAYAGLFFELFTNFEGKIEELFIGLLKGEVTHPQTAVQRKLKISPSVETENALLGGENYLKWLPLSITIKRAQIFFVNQLPFSLVTGQNIQFLANYQTIRNAIAHKSKSAMAKFNSLIAPLTLLPQERTPAGYLRSIPNPVANQTQLEIISVVLLKVLHILCH